MKWPELEFGDSVAGLLLDGVEETPFVGATLRLDDRQDVVVEVPYLTQTSAEQFANVVEWFSEKSPPANMILYTPEGTISMFDIEWSGHSQNWGGTKTSIGRLRPREVVFAGREGELGDPLKLGELHSYVDGLSAWSGVEAVIHKSKTDDKNRVKSVSIQMEGDTVLTWKQGSATMEFRSHWTHGRVRDGVGSLTTLRDTVTLVSTFETGAESFWDHFVEQRKIATLLVFLFGTPISFRKHQIRDERFAARAGGSGPVYDIPLREMLSRNTLRERIRPIPTNDELGIPLVYIDSVGAEGLAAWSDAYEGWARFIVPSAGVLNRRGAFVEDTVLSTSMSLEAAGGLLGEKAGEQQTLHRGRPTTATYAYRCLVELGLEWPARISSMTGLARAIANNYNDLKHADRGEFPDHVESYLVCEVNRFLVRALALTLTSSSDALRDTFQQSREMSGVHHLFSANRMSITDDGKWVEDAEPELAASLPAGLTLG
ncbi:MAG: hypothetical protein ACOH19_03140 [Rhodoglobus sp.]